jgi:hypothetical protein
VSSAELDFPPAGSRRYIWSFTGQIATTRRRLLKALSSFAPNQVRLTGGVRHPEKPMQPAAYLNLLGDSIFTPCGMGNANLETFRLYEALDCGSIPLVEKRPWLDYFTLLFGPHPLPAVSNWLQAPALMRGLLADRSRLEAKQAEVHSWWIEFQAGLRRKLNAVLGSAENKAGGSFPAHRFPGRFRGALEMLKHHNGPALCARMSRTVRRQLRLCD